jgi:hypothetical protein
MAPVLAPNTFWGRFFTGAYLSQKSDLLPPLERERNSVWKHVSSYQGKRSPGYYVLPLRTVEEARTSLIMEEQLFESFSRGADSNPARVNAQEVWHDRGIFVFKYSKTTSSFEYQMRHMYQSKLIQP